MTQEEQRQQALAILEDAHQAGRLTKNDRIILATSRARLGAEELSLLGYVPNWVTEIVGKEVWTQVSGETAKELAEAGQEVLVLSRESWSTPSGGYGTYIGWGLIREGHFINDSANFRHCVLSRGKVGAIFGSPRGAIDFLFYRRAR